MLQPPAAIGTGAERDSCLYTPRPRWPDPKKGRSSCGSDLSVCSRDSKTPKQSSHTCGLGFTELRSACAERSKESRRIKNRNGKTSAYACFFRQRTEVTTSPRIALRCILSVAAWTVASSGFVIWLRMAEQCCRRPFGMGSSLEPAQAVTNNLTRPATGYRLCWTANGGKVFSVSILLRHLFR